MHAVPLTPQRGGLPRTADAALRRVFMVVLFAVYAGGIVWLSRDRAAKHVPQVLIDAVEARRQTEELWLWRVMMSSFGPTAQVTVGDESSQCFPRPSSNRIPEDAVEVAATGDGALRIVSLAATPDGDAGVRHVEVRTLLVAPCVVNTSEWTASVHRLRAKIPEKATRAIDKVALHGAVVVEFVIIASD
eukprot:CAMPEP_0174846540 /NCGR_PEP_ID=MMETSP1114-20130205/12369_1 /TAXON_ID=312471 /ORGANISM="Neobodo designis, Strain CCAP 1951/1" /LENGTH=188 /DNA_ID=CAMNT_0016080803 /DNA_START=28 /DNA_END=591 /DNA_ORIENTATION=-